MACVRPKPSFDLEQLFVEARPKLLAVALAKGLGQHAEDCVQSAFLTLLDLVKREPQRLDNPDHLYGWLCQKTASLSIDHHRRTQRRPESPLIQVDEDGEERLIDQASTYPGPERRAAAKEIVDRNLAPFFSLLELRLKAHFLTPLIALARKEFPDNPAEQFQYLRIVVCSGTGEDKRDREDVELLAAELGKTSHATMTNLYRAQQQWLATEREIFCNAPATDIAPASCQIKLLKSERRLRRAVPSLPNFELRCA
jgi:hypothetical protein